MGETIMDIIFRNGQPQAAVHGGSSFNSIVSVGRAGVPCVFVGDTGADIVGRQTLDFMRANHVGTDYCPMRPDVKSAVSLAYLDDNGDASYVFYKQKPEAPKEWTLPQIGADDVLLYGSYFASCRGMRPLVEDMLSHATAGGAIIYYDINFRSSHSHELEALLPTIEDNCRRSSIVRGSADDFEVLFGERDAATIYDRHIKKLCPVFICTSGAGAVTVCLPHGTLRFPVPRVEDVASTVGEGTTVSLLLPGLPAGTELEAEARPTTGSALLAEREVLLVEDNEELATVTQQVLDAAHAHLVHRRCDLRVAHPRRVGRRVGGEGACTSGVKVPARQR